MKNNGKFKKRAKYNNSITNYNGNTYHSSAEAEYSKILDTMLKKGLITHIDRQVKFKLKNFNSKRDLEYRADFVVTAASGSVYVIEVKGYMTDAAKIKYAYVEHVHGVKIHLVATTGLKKLDTSFIK